MEQTLTFPNSWLRMLHNLTGKQPKMIARSLTAAGMGVAAKIVGLINQVVSVTLIAKALGAEGLQEQLLAIASVGWFGLALCGMHTSLPVLLIRRRTDSHAFATTAKTAFLLALIGIIGALALALAILAMGWPRGGPAAPIDAAMVCNAAGIVLSLSEKVFVASDRISQFNFLSMAGTAVSLAATALFARFHGTPADFVVSYYLGMLVPVFCAALFVLPRLDLKAGLPLTDFKNSARELLRVGTFGFGYEIASYCKFQAPLTLLSTMGLSAEIAYAGLGLRLVTLVSAGLSIIIPILLLRMGTALHAQDNVARNLWARVGIAGAILTAAASAILLNLFGDIVFRYWTGGAVTIDRVEALALAAFAATSLFQTLLFPLAAVDAGVADKMSWLFWLEGPLALAAGLVGANSVLPAYGGAGMLAGISLVAGVVALILVTLIAKKHAFPRLRDTSIG